MNRIIAVFLLLLVFSCRKENIEPGVTKPVARDIKEFRKNSLCDDAQVDEFTFREKKVYVFNHGSCGADMTAMVEDSDGNQLGSLGGYAGNMVIDGQNFSSATFVRVVWKKNS